MTVQHLPPRPLPEGQRYYADVVREIETRENLTCTGWHFNGEPSAERLAEIARVHEHCDPALLVARRVDTGAPGDNNWSAFRRQAA